MKRRVAILISGRGSNMAALIDAAQAAEFPAEIVAVISNRADAPGLEKAAASGIPTTVIESKPFGKDRASFEVVLQRALEENKVELIALLDRFDTVLNILGKPEIELLDSDIQALIDERQEARRRRDFARADEIRDELAELRIVLEDTKDGVRWKRR